MNTNEMNSAAQIDSRIHAISTTASTLRDKVQECAILIAIHAAKHGDYSKANKLVDALGDGVNGAALVEWFVKYVGLTIDTEKKCFGKEFIKENLDKAKANKWYTCKRVNPFAGYDFDKALASLLKQADTMAKVKAKATTEGDDAKASAIVINIDTLRQVRALSK
jgi:hypothetical protein